MINQNQFSYIIKIYTLLVIELIVTFSIIFFLRGYDTNIKNIIEDTNILLYIILSLALIVVIVFLPDNTPTPIKLAIFTLFAILKGIIIHLIAKDLDYVTLEAAMYSTILTFVGMSMVAFTLYKFKYDIGWIGIYLFAALIGLLIAHVVMMFKPPDKNIKRILLYIGIIIFSLFIVYDTNEVLLDKYNIYKNDFVTPALNFYIDFINIFTRFLHLEEL